MIDDLKRCALMVLPLYEAEIMSAETTLRLLGFDDVVKCVERAYYQARIHGRSRIEK